MFQNNKLLDMRPVVFCFYLFVMVGFFCAKGHAGTVLLLEPSTQSLEGSVYQRFFDELALVLVQDEVYRQSSDMDAFFELTPEQKIAVAGDMCGSDESLSVIWIELTDDRVSRMGLVVGTHNGKLARWVEFDARVGFSDLAIITGELLAHGRTFAASSTAQKDGWIRVDSDRNNVAQSNLSPSLLMDVEKPWDKPETKSDPESTFGRFALGVRYSTFAELGDSLSSRVWMGGAIHGTLWLTKRLAFNLIMDIHSGVIPRSKNESVAGIRLAPALSTTLFLNKGILGVLIDLAAGPYVTALRIMRKGQPTNKGNWLGGRARLSVSAVVSPNKRLSLFLGPFISFSLPIRRYVEKISDEERVVYASSLISIGGNAGVSLRF